MMQEVKYQEMNYEDIREMLHTTIDYIMANLETGDFRDLQIDFRPIFEPILIGDQIVLMGFADMADPDLQQKPPQTGFVYKIEVRRALDKQKGDVV